MNIKNLGFFLAIIAVLIFTGCEKKVTVEDFPNYLLNVDLTPGEEDKEVSVFLYTSMDKVDYKIQKKEKTNLVALIIENTFKSKKLNELQVDAINELVEKAYTVQVAQEKNKITQLSTKIIFRLKDPKTTFKVIIQPRPIPLDKLKKAAENSSSSAAAAIASKVAVEDKSDPAGLIKILVFWGILIIIVVVCIWSERKRRIDARAEKHYYDESEEETSENEETSEENVKTTEHKEIDEEKEED